MLVSGILRKQLVPRTPFGVYSDSWSHWSDFKRVLERSWSWRLQLDKRRPYLARRIIPPRFFTTCSAHSSPSTWPPDIVTSSRRFRTTSSPWPSKPAWERDLRSLAGAKTENKLSIDCIRRSSTYFWKLNPICGGKGSDCYHFSRRSN